MADDQPNARLSRSGRTSLFGKRSETVKASVSWQVKEEVTRRAQALGLNESEYLNAFLEVQFFGKDHAIKVHMARLDALSGTGPESGGDE